MTENNNIVIDLQNVSKTFVIRDKGAETIRDRVFNVFSNRNRRKIKALKNIDIQVKKGEFLGVIGRNGSGKSTLIHLMSGAYRPDKGGKASIHGNYIRLSLGMGFNIQLSARENILINASLLGLTINEIKEVIPEILKFAELEDFKDTQIKYYSSGMKSRLAFSIALYAKAEIFLMDEFFGTVGDKNFREKAGKIFEEKILRGNTIVNVSHNLEHMKHYADRVILIDKGSIVAEGEAGEIIEYYNKNF